MRPNPPKLTKELTAGDVGVVVGARQLRGGRHPPRLRPGLGRGRQQEGQLPRGSLCARRRARLERGHAELGIQGQDDIAEGRPDARGRSRAQIGKLPAVTLETRTSCLDFQN